MNFDWQPAYRGSKLSLPPLLLLLEVQLALTAKQQTTELSTELSQVGGLRDGRGYEVDRASAGLIGEGVDRHGAGIMAAGADTRSIPWGMRYLRIFAGGDGRSGVEDVVVEGEKVVTVEGVPPLLVSGPFSAGGISFVEQPEDAGDWEPHVAPRRQWVIVLRGRRR